MIIHAANYDLEADLAFKQAIEANKIDRSETCFLGFGFLSVKDLSELSEYVDEMNDTPW